MGAAESRSSSFAELFAALPPAGQEQLAALAEKGSTTLLKPHPAAPAPFPEVPVGVSIRLSTDSAASALSTVPRLQRKHYEMIPKEIEEASFFINFFSHVNPPRPEPSHWPTATAAPPCP